MEPEWARHQEIISIQKTQTEIIRKQTFFTELLTLATLVLAFSSILTLFNVKIPYENNSLALIFSVFSIILFFAFVGILIYKSCKYINQS